MADRAAANTASAGSVNVVSASGPGPATSGVAHLRNACIALGEVRERSTRRLSALLQQCRRSEEENSESSPPDIALILDPRLSGPLGLVAEVSLLKQSGVAQIFRIDSAVEPIETRCTNIVYIVRADVKLMEPIAIQVRHDRASQRQCVHWVNFVPRTSLLCERALSRLGVYGDVRVGELDLDFLPYDSDVLTCAWPSSFRSMRIEGDPIGLVRESARALLKIQQVFGIIPNVLGKGDLSRQIVRLLMRDRNEVNESRRSLIDSVILLDRSVDLFTPLLTQRTYEGLLDELIGIHNGYLEVDKKVLGRKGNGKDKTALNSNDTLYADIRDRRFNSLGPRLKQRAAFIQTAYEERHKAETAAQLKAFVKKFQTLLPEHNSLQVHINLAEQLSETTKTAAFHRQIHMEQAALQGSFDEADAFVDDLIGKQAPLARVLRYLCLTSLLQGGLKSRRFNAVRRDIIQAYGFEMVFTLENLRKAGLLEERGSARPPWSTLVKVLHLLDEKERDESQTGEPSSINYVFDGYAPLSARLVEASMQNGWKRMEDILALLPGKSFEFRQELASSAQLMINAASNDVSSGTRSKKVTLVFFVGGVTFSEISAMRFLSQHGGSDRDFIVVGTEIINGDQFIMSMVDEIENKLDKTAV